jgi:uncharacterized membrane protein YfcA
VPGSDALIRLLVIGVAAGVFSAVFGVGGGILLVPLLIAVVHRPPRVATAISLGAILVTSLAGTLLYALRGEVDVAYAALVGIPAVAGAFAGSTIQQRVPQRGLTLAFAGVVVIVGIWLLAG